MSKRILIVANYFEPGFKAGGPIRTIRNIIDRFKDRYQFFLITRNHDIGESEQYNLPVRQWINYEGYTAMYVSDKSFRIDKIKKHIAEIKPDVIYLNTFFNWSASIQFVLGSVVEQKRLILAPRGEFSKGALSVKKLKKRIFIKVANVLGLYKHVKFHASSESEAADIKAALKCGEVLVAPDLTPLRKPGMKENYGKLNGILRLCFISRICEQKNLLFCLKSLESIIHQGKNITLDIYGPIEDNRYWENCKKYIEKESLSKNIRYCRVLPPNDVIPTLALYDFLFFPTTGENFGHIIFESLSVGTPVILSDTTFWTSIIQEAKGGYIFDLNLPFPIQILTECLEMGQDTYRSLSARAFTIADSFARSSDNLPQTVHVFESVDK
jgi:glycosyltransferase involved in cell wall biosynthesis